jgi:type IV fimbrial biogenesis protein FimT
MVTPSNQIANALFPTMNPPTQMAKHEHGFTLIELAVVLAVLAILLAVALPSFRSTMITIRVKNASFDVFSSIIAARSDAITRNTTVTITPNSGNQWESGWVVRDAIGNILKTQDPLGGITITGPATLAYNNSGRLPAAVTPITLTATGATNTDARCISIDLSGRPVVAKGICL